MKDVGKTGLRFAKGNAITATLITGATETFGAGVKIAENYAKYQDKPEVLKRENAKAVGNAVNNTILLPAVPQLVLSSAVQSEALQDLWVLSFLGQQVHTLAESSENKSPNIQPVLLKKQP